MNAHENIPCQIENCRAHAVTFGGMCEDHEAEAFAIATPVAELMWIEENFARIERESIYAWLEG